MDNLVTNIQGYSIHDGPGIRTVVFLKGCGLECRWCSNPECISPRPEVGIIKALCTKCGKCADVCPQKAISFGSDGTPQIDRKLCNGCGICCEICAYKALVLYGKLMNANEIFEAVNRDKMFYESSGGGVTVSGGEPLLQSQLISELFQKCRQAGIHTCIETSGYAVEANLRQVLPLTDYIIYDLKHMNSEKHRQFTGKSNNTILSNAKIIAESGVEFLFRMPLVPGINNDKRNIKETADFLHGMGKNALRIELMPYHRLGKGKYESLGKEYQLSLLLSPQPEHIEFVRKAFEDNGISCMVSR